MENRKPKWVELRRLKSVALVISSAAVLTTLIVAIYLFGLDVHTTFGTGISPPVGNKALGDFLSDQDAEAAALSSSDESLLDGRLSDAALSDVVGQIHEADVGTNQSISFEPKSITVLRRQDPNDPTLLIAIREDGLRRVTTRSGPNAAPTEDQVSFHAEFWLRQSADGHYVIADQSIQNLPRSYLPLAELLGVGVLWLALAGVLIQRTRSRSIDIQAPSAESFPPLELPADDQVEGTGPKAKVVIRVFGGLQVLQDGEDWAPALASRPLMSFLWHLVLLAAIEDRTLTRDELGRQTTPKLDRETQLKKVRNMLQRLPELPQPLRARLVTEPKVIRFNLDDCWVDAIELKQLSRECERQTFLRADQVGHVRQVIDFTAGALMPEFESLEEIATGYRASSSELIANVRKELAQKRVALLGILANTYLAARRPEKAIEVLEPAIRGHPECKEVAEWLAAARHAIEAGEKSNRATAPTSPAAARTY